MIDVARWRHNRTKTIRWQPDELSIDEAIRAACVYSSFTGDVFWLHVKRAERDGWHCWSEILVSPFLDVESTIRVYG